MKTKTYTAKVKALDDAPEGTFEALVSVFGNVDHAGDRVVEGAFAKSLAKWEESGDPIPVVFSHRWDDLDAHIGKVLQAEETDDGLLVTAQLDVTDDPSAAKVHRLLKDRRIKEFSFAYDVIDEAKADGANELRELELIEVGPTLKGMNPDTVLVGAKSAIQSHSTSTSESEWDGPATEANLDNDAGADVYQQAYAWRDPDADPDAKAAYRFIHHEVSADGTVGDANVRACITGIGVLNGGRGGANIPSEDRRGVYNHLARHLEDADQEPPPLQDAASRDAKAGRVLSTKNETKLREARDAIDAVLSSLETSPADAGDEAKQQAKPEDPDRGKGEEPAVRSPSDIRLSAEIEALDL